MKKNKKQKNELSTRDYETLGRTLESIFEGGYINHKRVYKINLFRGIFFGFGVALGGTLIVTILIWLLSFFTELPLIGEFAETFRDSINSN